jgi:hypothetical protein
MPPRKKDKNGKEILTIREQRFVEGVARGESKTKAAKDAGYSPKSAETAGKKNTRKYPIQQAIQERISTIKADTNEILSLFALHLRGDFGDFDSSCWNGDGSVNWPVAKKRGLSRLVKKVKRRTIPQKNAEAIIETEVELYDAQSAGRTLAEIAGLKQQPRENSADKKERQKHYEALIQRIMDRSLGAGLEVSREQAIERVIEREPEAAKYLM